MKRHLIKLTEYW